MRDDPVAALHAEVDVEVGHRHAFRIEKALEQQVVAQRVHVGDAERVGDQRAAARAAPRSYGNVVALGPADELHDDQEVAGKAHLIDDAELVFQPFGVVGHRQGQLAELRETLELVLEPGTGLLLEKRFQGHALGHRVIRQVVLAERHLNVAAPGDLYRVLECLGQIGEQLRHLLGALQVLLRAVTTLAPRIVEGPSVVNADASLVSLEVRLGQKAHVVGRDHRQAQLRRQRHRQGDVGLLALAAGPGELEIVAVGKRPRPVCGQTLRTRLVTFQQQLPDVAFPAAGQHQQAVGVGEQLLPGNGAALDAADVRAGHQGEQVGVPRIVHGHDAQPAPLPRFRQHRQIHADQGFDAGVEAGPVVFHQREQVGPVGERQGRHVELPGAGDQRLDLDDAVRQGVLAVHPQVDEARPRHGNSSPDARTSPRASAASPRLARTGAKDRRCSGLGPRTARASRWAAVA